MHWIRHGFPSQVIGAFQELGLLEIIDLRDKFLWGQFVVVNAKGSQEQPGFLFFLGALVKHTGLKVSSLYIAQVKQKCGIIERENYNKPKSEDARQPQCPPEKEKAIKEALQHFGMI